MNKDYKKAHSFLFDETYKMWKSDMDKIFRIGTRTNEGGCNLSSCILVFIGIESFSKFFSDNSNNSIAFSEFIDNYYPRFYNGKMKNVYELFRHGLAHNFYPKSEFRLTNASKISFGVDKNNRVFPLSKIRKDLDKIRKNIIKLKPFNGKPYVIVPQILYLDTINVMEAIKKDIVNNEELQNNVVKNFSKIQRELRHNA